MPFTLTDEQEKVVAEIREDLVKAWPMQRLLQGDVGSGKTVVAAIAACQAIDNGFQVAMMAPTEILAEQHFQRLNEWMAPLGISVVWLNGSMKKKAKEEVLSLIGSGEAQFIVGTHALIQESVRFAIWGWLLSTSSIVSASANGLC